MEYLERLESEAELHGSGVFSCDLDRMQKVLGSHQLACPEDYVLSLLAAAVLHGAKGLRLEEKRGTTRFFWDGPSLTSNQLQDLIPSLGRKGSFLAELALALLAARKLGEVRLDSAHGRAYFRGDQLIVDQCNQDCENCLTLRRKWWHRVTGRARQTRLLLRERGQFAPLQLSPKGTPDQISVAVAFRCGQIEADWLSAHDWVEIPVGTWGAGVAYFGHGDWRLVRHGVTYPFPAAIQGVVVVWWSEALPLDLSRKQLLNGPEFKAWLSWLHDHLSEVVLTRDLREHLPGLIRSSNHCKLTRLLDFPLFRYADGQPATLARIREEYREHGWLPVISRPMSIEWEPQRVVVMELPHELQLGEVFLNWLNLDHLENQTGMPRLPADQEYVVRIPFFKGNGEAGLRRYPSYYGFREYLDGEWQGRHAFPFGMDAARGARDAGTLPIGELYWTLHLMPLDDTFRHLRGHHLLVFFGWLKIVLSKTFKKQFSRRHPLEVLLDLKSQVEVQHCRGKIRTPQLQQLAASARLYLQSGETLAVRELSKATDSQKKLQCCCLRAPSGGLALDFAGAAALGHLFLPGTLTEVEGKAGEGWMVTNVAFRMLQGVTGPAHLLRRLLDHRNCAANRMLQALGRVEEVRKDCADQTEIGGPEGLEEVVRRASDEMRAPERHLSTAYLMVALAEQADLGTATLLREELLPLLAEWGEFENLEDLVEYLPLLKNLPDYESRNANLLAFSYLRAQRYQDARQLAIEKLCKGTNWPNGLMVLGLCDSLQGDLEGGLQHFREAVERSSEKVYATCLAESLLWLGRRDEARAACPDGDDQYTLMIRASLAQSPEECLRLCDLVEAAGPGQYFELNEARGHAYYSLGRLAEARECLLRFVEARPDNSMLDLYLERIDRARHVLAILPSPENTRF